MGDELDYCNELSEMILPYVDLIVTDHPQSRHDTKPKEIHLNMPQNPPNKDSNVDLFIDAMKKILREFYTVETDEEMEKIIQ